jgi:DUF4097 and DUF4098 domain-containing protein YvlB
MFTGIVLAALSVAGLVQQTDTIVQANGASRLELESARGEVVVRTWDRDAVQIKANNSESRSLDIQRSGSTISIEVRVERGMGLTGSVDFEITVPRAFDLNIEGMALEVNIEGTEGKVEVSNVRGSIRVQGGRGTIVLESVMGEVIVEGAQGDLDVTATAGGVTIRNCSGDISAESVGGDLTLEGIASHDVEAGTVGGNLRFEGAIQDGGLYNFGSHGGHIWLHLPVGMNARVEAVTLAGEMEIDYPGAPAEPTRGEGIPGLREKELSFEVGTGSARIEVETFGGTVHILRQGGNQ